jgi:hypothetical protein
MLQTGLYTGQLLTKEQELFGLSTPCPRELWEEIKPLVWGRHHALLQEKLEYLGDNVKCVAKPLLENIFRLLAMEAKV